MCDQDHDVQCSAAFASRVRGANGVWFGGGGLDALPKRIWGRGPIASWRYCTSAVTDRWQLRRRDDSQLVPRPRWRRPGRLCEFDLEEESRGLRVSSKRGDRRARQPAPEWRECAHRGCGGLSGPVRHRRGRGHSDRRARESIRGDWRPSCAGHDH